MSHVVYLLTSDTWALHLRLSRSGACWPGTGWVAPGGTTNSGSLGRPATATHTTRSFSSSSRRVLVRTTWV